MVQSIMDPCLFFKKEKAKLVGMIGTLVDDSLGIGTSAFADEEERKSKRFDVKPSEEVPFSFQRLRHLLRKRNGQAHKLLIQVY